MASREASREIDSKASFPQAPYDSTTNGNQTQSSSLHLMSLLSQQGSTLDIRPIAVGEALRRLTGKCLCALVCSDESGHEECL